MREESDRQNSVWSSASASGRNCEPAPTSRPAIGCRTLLVPMSPPGEGHGLEDVLRFVG